MPDDVIIVPETRLGDSDRIYPGNRKIVLCQNPFLVARLGFLAPPELIGSICTSHACLSAMERLLPGKRNFLVPLWLEEKQFRFEQEKQKQILFMPRKGGEEARMVLNLLEKSGSLEGWKVTPVDGVAASEVAKMMRDSLVFLSFAQREGFGLPGAEAIACGCLVIGYTGIGGDEYFSRFGGWPVQQQDVLGFADKIAAILREYEQDPSDFDLGRQQQSASILAHYNRGSAASALSQALRALALDHLRNPSE